MGFLESMIRRGISQGISNAVGQAVQKAVEPKATELANQAANRLDQAAQNYAEQGQQMAQGYAEQMSQAYGSQQGYQQTNTQNAQVNQQTGQSNYSFAGLEGALANLKRSVESYVTDATQNMKVCPNCETPCGADKKFCPSCGTKLPETTIAQSAVCPNCGKQNGLGTKFCSDCGTKLPIAIQEEQAEQAKLAQVMTEWDQLLPAYPKWNLGGKEHHLENFDNAVLFGVRFPNNFMAQEALNKYRAVLQENGFCMAGKYPGIGNLYKKVGSICYHVSTENCFACDDDYLEIYFNYGEPEGGFDYVKPEPQPTMSLKDLFKF